MPNNDFPACAPELNDRRPSVPAILGFFLLAFAIGMLLSKIGLFRSVVSVSGSVSFVSAFLIGLVAASSSCMAVSGGLLIATTAKFNERMAASGKKYSKSKPVFLFTAGRVVSYAFLGGLIGYIGKNIGFSPVVAGAITLAAALVMIMMGADMLKIVPKGLKKMMPRMPLFLARAVMGAEASTHPAAPFLLGAGTFFLPCGFTQALQIYAVSSGSFFDGAMVLGGFALGTVPALFAVGAITGSRAGSARRFFFRLAGAAVIIMGVLNVGNGYNLLGLPPLVSYAASVDSSPAVFEGKTQVVSMDIGPDGYSPSSISITAGAPIRWVVDASRASGCQMGIVSRQFGIQSFLVAGKNEIEFTAPSEPGTYQFSCPMGMYRGQFVVAGT